MEPYAKSGVMAPHISTSAPDGGGGGGQVPSPTSILSE